MPRPLPVLPDALALCALCQKPLREADRLQAGTGNGTDDGPWTLMLRCRNGHKWRWLEGDAQVELD